MANLSGKSISRLLAAVLMTGGLVIGAGPARAGFEFSPPPHAAPAAPQAAPDAVPAAPAGAVDMAPLPDDMTPPPSGADINPFPMKANAPAAASFGAAALPLPEPPPAPGTPVPVPDGRHALTAPGMTPPPPVSAAAALQPMPQAAPAPVPAETGFATVSGFGTDMPLVLAMRQIVPPAYAYSFDPSANPGVRVSWEGGRPWDRVLDEALAPYGMKAIIAGKAVRVVPARDAAPESGIPALTILSGAPASAAAPAAEPPQSYPPRMPHKALANDGMMPMAGPASLPPGGAAPAMIYPAPAARMAGTATDDSYQSYPHRQPHPHDNMPGAAAAPPPVLTPAPPPAPQSIQAKAPPSWFYYSGQHQDAVRATGPDDGMMAPPAAPAPALAPAPMMAPMVTPPPPPAQAPPMSLSSSLPPAEGTGAAAVTPAAGIQTASHAYNAEAGQSLKMVLEQWSQQAGVDLAWTSISDYSLPRAVHTTGTFADAVKDALMAYENDLDRPIGTLHTNTANGAPVLEIKSFAAGAGST
jgi:hypothetical protein